MSYRIPFTLNTPPDFPPPDDDSSPETVAMVDKMYNLMDVVHEALEGFYFISEVMPTSNLDNLTPIMQRCGEDYNKLIEAIYQVVSKSAMEEKIEDGVVIN